MYKAGFIFILYGIESANKKTLNFINKNKIGDFSFNPNYRFVVDWIAWLELSQQKGRFVYINQALIQHRIHEKSATTNEMKDGARTREEKEILSIIWGKWRGGIIAFVYQLSHFQNQTK
jgi:hypothetical protein